MSNQNYKNPGSIATVSVSGSDPSRSREEGLTRREAVLGMAAAGMLLALGLRACKEKENPDQNSKDVLTDPEKTTKFISDYLETSERLAEDPAMPLPYELFLAVGMHESDSGTSELATNANNIHGIVAKDGWKGKVYEKPTEEQVSPEAAAKLKETYGDKFSLLYKYGDGSVRVRYPRPFRRYDKPEQSFADFQKKVYFQNQDGSYRYQDVVDYLQSGGRDPKEVARLMVDSDEAGELRYATGEEWLNGVNNYINLIQGMTGNISGNIKPAEPKPNLPPEQSKIDIESIDFSELNEPRDQALIKTLKEALSSLSTEDYTKFKEKGIEDRSQYVKDLIGAAAYQEYYAGERINIEYIIWHLWANGVQNPDGSPDPGTPTAGPKGNSQKASLSDQIKSWANGSHSSTQFIMSDNSPVDVWQLAADPATKAGHIRSGVMDNGKKGREDVRNGNSLGIEVQANSIYDVSPEQFKALILWTTKMLFDQALIDDGMLREQTDAIIEHSVIGHGKNSGLEFGLKYRKPLIEALKQYVFMAIQA